MRYRQTRILLWMLIAIPVTLNLIQVQPVYSKSARTVAPKTFQHRVLIDSIHAHNFLTRGLTPSNRDYHSLFGLKDGVSYLREQGFRVAEISSGVLNSQQLDGFDTLLINLVSDNLPAFFVEEIFAIDKFVKNGGNLLVITDHSNTYHHTWKLQPLFRILGIALYNESVLEKSPNTIGPGPGWINIRRFKAHPVTNELTIISFHSGGAVDVNGGIAFSSESSWGDQWATATYGENCLKFGNRGNYGNFIEDPGERKGPLSVVMAREIGSGKVVVLGDQNAVGNLWIRYGDNYRLFMNIFYWFSNKSSLREYSTFLSNKRARILLLDNLGDSQFGNYGDGGLYYAYAELARYEDTYINDRIDYEYDLVVASPSVRAINHHQLDAIRTHLAEGRSLVVLSPPQNAASWESIIGEELVSGPGKGRRDTKFKSKPEVVVYEDYMQFTNEAFHEPTNNPTKEEAQVADKWLALIRRNLK